MIKRLGEIILVAILGLLVLAGFFYWQFRASAEIEWGLNFSIRQAEYLGFDWQKMYLDILDDLKPKRLRVVAYWQNLEPEPGQFTFQEFDELMLEGRKRDIEIILAVGHKLPRWPECNHPAWYENLSKAEQEERWLLMLEKAVSHFREFDVVVAWQVENEPFFPFGPECESVPRNFYEKELGLVKSLDKRPIVVTDSGEKGAWLPTALMGGEIFGSTMYREVYHHERQKYIKYPVPPALYRIKAGMVKTFSRIDRFIGVELQAEPWFATNVFDTPWQRQQELMNPEIFMENIEYAKKVGFAENYFWGVEWWYWAMQQGHPEMWEAAKTLMNSQ